MFLFSRILQANSLPWHLNRQKGCIRSRIIGHVVTIAARALHVLHANFFFGHAQHFGNGFTCLKDRLTVRLDCQHTIGP